jgi:hypothetical protein
MSTVPVWALEIGATVLGKGAAMRRLTRSLEVDTSSFRAATGWQASDTLQSALARIAAHRRAGGAGGATTRSTDATTRGP